jgi:hypothetical protein
MHVFTIRAPSDHEGMSWFAPCSDELYAVKVGCVCGSGPFCACAPSDATPESSDDSAEYDSEKDEEEIKSDDEREKQRGKKQRTDGDDQDEEGDDDTADQPDVDLTGRAEEEDEDMTEAL